ncbi:MAG TPA: NAD(P)H-hydrate dehydratase [Negativicutes bacterium]|nr:NAD(P)H-hydrate dehydratase [Negativicutes bacterium]
MKVAMVEEMKYIEATAMDTYGIPGAILMENAGAGVARALEEMMDPLRDKKICIFSGHGNNGGDGYVVARYAHNAGAKVKIFVLGKTEQIQGDARLHFEIVQKMKIDIIEILSDRDWDKVRLALLFTDGIVDAMLGTGFRGEIRDHYAEIFALINNSQKPVIAVDLPSGLHADTGFVSGYCIKADKTVTFGLPKPGLLLYPGTEYVGALEVIDIGIPLQLLEDEEIKQNLITAAMVTDRLPQRAGDAHKGDNGRISVIAGSEGLTGAAVLASYGALRSGGGLVTLGVPRSLHDIMESKCTEVMTRPLPENPRGVFSLAAQEPIQQMARTADVLLLGPGLSTCGDIKQLVQNLVRCISIPMIIDADGLNALTENMDVLEQAAGALVFTPHPGEMARLAKMPISDVQANRLEVARTYAQRWGATVILKGARTVIATPDGQVYINITGNPLLATGGTGDVLAGLIAGFIGQGMTPEDAAVAAVYTHGRAADLLAQETGDRGALAGELLSMIPKVLRELTEN